jgi:hypothetical protein
MIRSIVWLLILYILTLCACGGGGGGSDSSSKISGTAAAGYPLAGTVTLKDSAGNQRQSTINASGNFSIDVSGFTPPFVLFANGTVGARSYQLYSAATSAGTTNITPLTNLIVASAAQVKNPKDVFDNPATYTGKITNVAINKAVSDIKKIFKSLLDAHNVSSMNPLSDAFTVYSAGMDTVLDTLKIDIDPNTGTVSIWNRQTGMPLGSTSVTNIDNATPIKYAPYIYGVGGDGTIKIWWNEIMNATSYNLYWSTTPGVGKANGTKKDNVTGPYELAGLTNGVNYHIVITPVFPTGEGETSNEVSVIADPDGISFITLKKGVGKYTHHASTQLYKITDQDAFKTVWDTYNDIYIVIDNNVNPAPMPEVDFSTDMVIVVAGIEAQSGIEITKITEQDGKLKVGVFYTSTVPEGNGLFTVPATIRTPLHIVKLRKSDLEPEISFGKIVGKIGTHRKRRDKPA